MLFKIVRSPQNINIQASLGTAVTIGNFDGVHLGHQALISRLKQKAALLNLPTIVVIFEPQPKEFFVKSDRHIIRLTTLREKLYYLKNLQVDYVICLKFNDKIANMSALKFAEDFLLKELHARYILLGEDFRFGYQREGDITLLSKLLASNNSIIEEFKHYKANNLQVSSTAIRNSLMHYNLPLAKTLLGHAYSFIGTVSYGQGFAKTFGVPTANIHIKRSIMHISGIFCVKVQKPDGKIYNGVASIGMRPTVCGEHEIIEVHLFDIKGNFYGQRWIVFLEKFLRKEKKFSSIDKMVAQIHEDVEQAKQYFNE